PELGVAGQQRGRRVTLRAPGDDLFGSQAEDENVLGADGIANLDVRAVERADGQRTVQRQLHVARAGRFHAGGRDLLRQVRGRHDLLRQRHVVIGQETNLELVADARV